MLQLAGARLVHCTLLCITHTCLQLGHLYCSAILWPFSTCLCREPLENVHDQTRQDGSHNKIVQRECQIFSELPTALVDAPQTHTRSSIIYSHVWVWGSTSRGDLRHFSREEESAPWRARATSPSPTYANIHLLLVQGKQALAEMETGLSRGC